jgi:hypothetical protein
MASIIFQNIIEKVNSASQNVSNYLNNIDTYNSNIYTTLDRLPKYNVVLYILIIFLIYNFVYKYTINLNDIFILLICILIINYLMKKDYTQFMDFTNKNKIELQFLNKLMFNSDKYTNGQETNVILQGDISTKKTYLYLNPLIIRFFYNIREYSQYNISSYVNSLYHCNNVIALDYQTKIGLNRQYYNYETAINESKKALNELETVIYTLPSAIMTYNKFNDSIRILQGLLNEHLISMSTIFKYENKVNDLQNTSRPDNFYDENFTISANDMETDGFISTYNMF